MVSKIYKYPLPAIPGERRIIMPKGSHVLSAGLQGNDTVIWVSVDSSKEHTERIIYQRFTGQDEPDMGRFVGTVVHGMESDWLPNGLVVHVYDGGEEVP